MTFDRGMACFYTVMTAYFIVTGIFGLTLPGMAPTQRAIVVALCASAAGGMGWAAVEFWRLGRQR